MSAVLLAAAISFSIAFALTPLCRSAAIRRGRLDIPNERSSHVIPTPRNGGHAIVTAIFVTCAITMVWQTRAIAWAIAGSASLILVALADERRPVSPLLRLVVHMATVSIVIVAGGIGRDVVQALSYPGGATAIVVACCVVWVVGNLNAYNFMDGVNGIASAEAIVAGVTYAILFLRQDHSAAALCAALAAAAAGFIPWNLPSGSIFMGDTGSTTFGYFFAIAALLAVVGGTSPVAAALPLTPFISDTVVTFFRRAARGERVWTPHRSHFYQLLNRSGFSHAAVTAVWSALAIVACSVTVVYEALTSSQRMIAVMLVLAVHTGAFASIELVFRSRAKLNAG